MKILKITTVLLIQLLMAGHLEAQALSKAGTGQKQSGSQGTVKNPVIITDTVFFELPDTGNYKADRPSYDELPEFPGGKDSLNAYILRNTKYPQSAVNDKLEGRIFMRFAIETDGSIADIQVFIGIRADMNDECARVVAVLACDVAPGVVGA